jgi:hypothetical protein
MGMNYGLPLPWATSPAMSTAQMVNQNRRRRFAERSSSSELLKTKTSMSRRLRFLLIPMRGLEPTIVGELARCQKEFDWEGVMIRGELSSSEISMTPRSVRVLSSREGLDSNFEAPGVWWVSSLTRRWRDELEWCQEESDLEGVFSSSSEISMIPRSVIVLSSRDGFDPNFDEVRGP